MTELPIFSSNLSKSTLLFNFPIKVWFDDYEIAITIPVLKELYSDTHLLNFVGILKGNKQEDLNNLAFSFSTHYGFVLGLLKLDLQTLSDDLLLKYYKKYFNGLSVTKHGFFFPDGKPLTEEQYLVLEEIFLIGCGEVPYRDLPPQSKPEESKSFLQKWEERKAALDDKVKKIKGSNTRVQYLPERLLLGITHFLPSYTLQSLLEVNPFTLAELETFVIELENRSVFAIASAFTTEKKQFSSLFSERGE